MKINYHFGASSDTEEIKFVETVKTFFGKDGEVTSIDVVGAVVTVQVTLKGSWSRRFSVSDLNQTFNRSCTNFKVEDDKIYCQYTLSKRRDVKVDSQAYAGVDLSKNLVLGSNDFGELVFLPVNRNKLTLVSGGCGSGKTYFLQNAIKKLIYANSSEDLQILVFSPHGDSFSFLKGSRFLHQSKIFKDLKKFVETMKNLDNENVLIVAEELEYASYAKSEDQPDLMKEPNDLSLSSRSNRF